MCLRFFKEGIIQSLSFCLPFRTNQKMKSTHFVYHWFEKNQAGVVLLWTVLFNYLILSYSYHITFCLSVYLLALQDQVSDLSISDSLDSNHIITCSNILSVVQTIDATYCSLNFHNCYQILLHLLWTFNPWKIYPSKPNWRTFIWSFWRSTSMSLNYEALVWCNLLIHQIISITHGNGIRSSYHQM